VANVIWGERPIALEKDILQRRIYAPAAYAPVRDTAVVPVVHSETHRLAVWFPLVWRGQGSHFTFVAVRSLLNDQRAQPPVARSLLPLVLHAYPFVFDPKMPPAQNSSRFLDDVFADNPTDVGATITTVSGSLSRATLSRLRILDALARDFPITAAITDALANLGVLEPWQLKFDIAGTPLELPDLFVVRKGAFNTGILSNVLDRFAMPAALILGFHRISLFRAGLLLAMTRKFLTDPPTLIGHEHSPSAP
jgi:hypothetical protein